MRRAALATLAALFCAGAVLAYTATIEPVYEAKAFTKLDPLLGAEDLLAVVRLEDRRAQLDVSPQNATLPQGDRSLRRIVAAAATDLSMTREALRESVRVYDTSLMPLFPAFQEQPRRLKVAAVSHDAATAARIANTTLRAYLRYRQRWLERRLGRIRRYLRREIRNRQRPLVIPSGPPNLEEGLDAAALVGRLERQTHGPIRTAQAPPDEISPHRARDAIVAALVGGLVGWFGPLAFGRRGSPRSPRTRRRYTDATCER